MSRLARALAAGAALLALLASLTSALTIPEDLVDGVYEIDWLRGSEGTIASWSYFEMPHDVEFTAVKFNGKVPLPVKDKAISCLLKDRRLDSVTLTDFTRRDDQDKAMKMLENWCESTAFIQKCAIVFALYNDMLWYVCNWDTSYQLRSVQQRCSRLELQDARKRMDAKCGRDKRSEVTIGAWTKTYGRSHRFGDICEGKETWT
ncbi:hypothetical protein A9K55_008580 [Cordyceps militaris]|uniref:Uncharacterized protein n=1 Tax=Cordyceps militaris TaxID=73501 RepID=A0A2H4SEQ4_CORMI|nr:hypothetical protein A9K55_008580 [Cordyceps militaris]